MPRRRIQPTHLNTDLPEPLQYRFLETTNRARPEVVDDVKVEDLKRARRGRPLFEQFEKERGTRTSIEETDVSLAGRREYLKTMDKPDALIIESLHKTVFKPHFEFVQQIAGPLLHFVDRLIQLVRPLEILDHLRPVLFPVFENHLSEPVSVVHLRPPRSLGRPQAPYLLLSSLSRCLRKGQADSSSQ